METSTLRDSCPIAIIDPALGRTGAHNRAFAELLLAQAEQAAFGIWCDVSLDRELQDRLTARGVFVQPGFTIDFYQILRKPGGVADHWEWICALASQYLHALTEILTRWPDGAVRVLHHTMSWEHATALSLALRLAGARGDCLEHMVLLMYSPGIDESGTTFDADCQQNYRLAFHSLDTLPNVHLYAGCGEYARAYAALLQRPAAIPVHPCLVGDWRRQRAPRKPVQLGHERVVLYLGEIKQEKGFLSLPGILRRQLRESPSTRQFVIQFVNVRNDASRRVLAELQRIAADHPNVELHHGFWSEARLHQELAACDVLHLDYDAGAYAHKTSGLLWLAAWHEVPVAVPPGSWLYREARRLGLPIIADTSAEPRVDATAADAAYRQRIFTPFWQWLEGDGVPPCRSAYVPRRPLAGSANAREGADVVVFWKQNDSTLYGRRVDMVVRYLASRPDIRRVVVVDAPIGQDNLAQLEQNAEPTDHGRAVHARTLQKLAGALDTDKVAYKVYVCPTREYRFREDGSDRPRFIEGYIEFLQDAFAKEGVDPRHTVFWIYPRNFHAPALLRKFTPARTVVDIVDDDRAWPGVPQAMKCKLTESLGTLLRTADMAFANCEPVLQSMRELFPAIRLVPNGCDPEPPGTPVRDDALREFTRRRGKVIGFAGNLEAKIDIPLLHKVAERFHGCHIVLIGSTHANPQVRELSRHPNVSMPGMIPYDQLDAWLRRFDVGLVPHLEMDLTRFMNPLKVYVYLSRNIPVVATAVPNLDDIPGLLHVAPTHAGFLAAIGDVLAAKRPAPQAFREYIHGNSWASRFRVHVDELLHAQSAG